MKRKGIVVVVAVGIIVLAVLAVLLFRRPTGPEKVEKLKAGLFADSKCALVYIGREQGFFKQHGLDLAVDNYQAGAYAVNDLLSGKVDVAAATEFVLAIQGIKRPDLRAIAAISSSDSIEVVARKDRGIKNPEDLKGKRIGFNKDTINHFFLTTFLSLYNIRFGGVKAVDLKPSEMLTALSEVKVDALISLSNFLDPIKKVLAGRIVSWPAQGGRNFYSLLITKDGVLKTRPQAIESLLKGVIEAEAFLKAHEGEAQHIVKAVEGIDRDALMTTWSKTRFFVRLDQDLLTLMEDEGRWAIRNKLVEIKTIPDYLALLSRERLQKIKPEAVGVN